MVEHNQTHLHLPPYWWTRHSFAYMHASARCKPKHPRPNEAGTKCKGVLWMRRVSVRKKMKRITENCRTATLRTVSVSNGCESISKASILKELGHGHGHGLHAHQIKICICIFIQQKCQARRAVLCPRFCSPSSSICVQLTRPGHKKKAVRATAQKRYNSRRELRFKFSV